MQSFPDLANKDNDAIPARELLNVGIKIRFMDESVRWVVGRSSGDAPTVVYGRIGRFIFTRLHTSWCITRQDLKSFPSHWAKQAPTELEFATTDVYDAPSGWGCQCYKAYTPRGLAILAYRCKCQAQLDQCQAQVERYQAKVEQLTRKLEQSMEFF